jgi:hypothetical protein
LTICHSYSALAMKTDEVRVIAMASLVAHPENELYVRPPAPTR